GAIADIDAPVRNPDIVGIISEVDAIRLLPGCILEDANRTIPRVRDPKRARSRLPADALRLGQPVDARELPTGREIDHGDAVIAKFGYEKPMALDIGGKVVNAPLDGPKRDVAIDRERGRLRQHGVQPHGNN